MTMPLLFIGHGSPMNAVEDNDYTRAWRAIGKALPRPRAILVVSAHWFIGATAVTAMPRPRTIHDFYGFPESLFAVEYPAPGLPELAGEIAELAKPAWVGADRDQWGIDHGAWSILAHLFPDADVPVVQLSINALKDWAYHFELGARLAPLRRRDVLVLASGNIVHNLRRIDWRAPGRGEEWARRFDDWAERSAAENPERLVAAGEHGDFQAAVPTPDHYLPLLYVAGAAAAEGAGLRTLVKGYDLGSLSMTCLGLGLEEFASREIGEATTVPQAPPPDQANI